MPQHDCLAENLLFMGDIWAVRQRFRAFDFQNAHGGMRMLPDKDKIAMCHERHFSLFAPDFQLGKGGDSQTGQAFRHALFKPVTALQREQTRQICRSGIQLCRYGGTGTFRKTGELAHAQICFPSAECLRRPALRTKSKALPENIQQGLAAMGIVRVIVCVWGHVSSGLLFVCFAVKTGRFSLRNR